MCFAMFFIGVHREIRKPKVFIKQKLMFFLLDTLAVLRCGSSLLKMFGYDNNKKKCLGGFSPRHLN